MSHAAQYCVKMEFVWEEKHGLSTQAEITRVHSWWRFPTFFSSRTNTKLKLFITDVLLGGSQSSGRFRCLADLQTRQQAKQQPQISQFVLFQFNVCIVQLTFTEQHFNVLLKLQNKISNKSLKKHKT
jgi:hypothetical protein